MNKYKHFIWSLQSDVVMYPHVTHINTHIYIDAYNTETHINTHRPWSKYSDHINPGIHIHTQKCTWKDLYNHTQWCLMYIHTNISDTNSTNTLVCILWCTHCTLTEMYWYTHSCCSQAFPNVRVYAALIYTLSNTYK